MRWQGFRKVRKQVCKKISRRFTELNLADTESYRLYLNQNPDEWLTLDTLCRITISRFYRDRGLFDYLGSRVLPGLAQKAVQAGHRAIHCLCIGAASGEEPYSISLLWELTGIPGSSALDFEIIATEIDPALIERAQKGCYPASSIRELPADWLEKAFDHHDNQYCLKQRYRNRVQFVGQDIRQSMPVGPYHLILCRNLVFTYFDNNLQHEVLDRIAESLLPGGSLVLGMHESLPQNTAGLVQWNPRIKVFKKELTELTMTYKNNSIKS
jgi:chemotaxis protein methyltransferase CheR